jgi:hypothetical protein
MERLSKKAAKELGLVLRPWGQIDLRYLEDHIPQSDDGPSSWPLTSDDRPLLLSFDREASTLLMGASSHRERGSAGGVSPPSSSAGCGAGNQPWPQPRPH